MSGMRRGVGVTRADRVLEILREEPRDSRRVAVALGLGGSRASATSVNGTLQRLYRAGKITRWREEGTQSPFIWGLK